MLFYHYISLPSANVSTIPKTTLYAWGLNSFGQLGDGTAANKITPVAINSQFSPTSSSGNNHTAIVYSDGSLYMTGLNSSGQLGDGTTINKSTPVKIGSSSWTTVSAQADSTVGLTIDGALFTWGRNSLGELGLGDADNRSSPVQVSGYSTSASYGSWAAVSTENGFNLAIKSSDSSLWSWGENASGQLGDGSTINKSTPVLISKKSWLVVNTGASFATAIDAAGVLYAWGQNNTGQLGDGTTVSKSTPVQINIRLFQAASFSGSGQYLDFDGANLALGTGDFTIEMWAYANSYGSGGTDSRLAGSQNNSNAGWSMTIRNSGTINFGSWSTSTDSTLLAPVQTWNHIAWTRESGVEKLFINGVLSNTVTRSLNMTTTAASIGRVFSTVNLWNGYVSNFRIVKGTAVYTSAFTPSTTPLTVIANTVFLTCNSRAIVDNGGNNYTITNTGSVTVTNFTPFSSVVNVSKISTGQSHTVAIDSTGALYAWGGNATGQLGDNTTVNKSSAVLIGSSSWSAISTAASHTAGITSDGKLFAWGGNATGQLGDGTTINKSSPVQIGTSSWTTVSSNNLNTIGIEIDGSLYAWGSNASGQIGDGTVVNRSSPVAVNPVATNSSWRSISSSRGSYTVAIRSQDSSLWAWGDNAIGKLGDGTTVNKSQPIKIGNDSWSVVSAGISSAFGITTAGALYAWGGNAVYQLGDGTTVNKSTPVLITNYNTYTFTANTVSLNGSSQWLTVPNSSNYNFGTTPFTVEFWFNTNESGREQTMVSFWNNPAGARAWQIAIGVTNNSGLAINSAASTLISVAGSIVPGIWYHAAFVGDGTNMYYYLNGVSQAAPVTQNFTSVANDPLYIGKNGEGAGTPFNGFISDLRIVKGTAVYTRNFTPSTAPLTAIANTVLLTCNSGTIVDNSGSNITVTNTGTATVSSRTISALLPDYNTSWSAVSAGESHTTAIDSTGSLWAWGNNSVGQVGYLTAQASYTVPIKIATTSSPYSWKQLSANDDGTLTAGITATGALFTWGAGTNGQLGDGTTVTKSLPIQIGTSSWNAVSAGNGHLVAADINGNLFTWGSNATGQLGDGTTINKSSPVKIGSQSWSVVSAGFSRTTAIDIAGNLYSWGGNASGQLGDSTTVNRSSPVQVPVSLNYYSWTKISAGTFGVAAITNTGALYVWGSNSSGSLGDNTTVNKSTPVKLGSSSWSFVSTNGEWNTAAITSTGALFTWGSNSNGSLGDGTTVSKSSPVQIGNNSWSIVNINIDGASAIDSTGGLFTWGLNTSGQLGDGTTVNKSSPVKIGTSSWTTVSSSGNGNNMAAIDSTGALYAWGQNSDGRLGSGTTLSRSSPVKIGTSSWSKVSAGYFHTAAIDINGNLFTWGYNGTGALGDGTTINKSSPVKIGSSSWSVVATGINGTFTHAITTTGELYAWGTGNTGQLSGGGQLGDGTTLSRSSPVKIGTSSWTTVASGGHAVVPAIRIDGNLFVWGNGSQGGLGDGTTVAKLSPVMLSAVSSPEINNYSSWTSVSAGNIHTAGITSDGKLFDWGGNATGQLGDGTTINRSIPVQVATTRTRFNNFRKIEMAGTGSSNARGYAIKGDGTLWAWGTSTNGALGDGTAGSFKSSPIQIGTRSWSFVTSGLGPENAAAIDTTGALYVWGSNSLGQIGDGTTINKSSPVQIGTSSWSMVSAGDRFIFAIDTVGRLFGWGNNDYGRLGDGTSTPRSSPVQLGASSWSFVNTASGYTAAITSDKALYMWGGTGAGNSLGALGDGTTIDKRTPQKIGNSSWSIVSVGNYSTMAIRIDGSLWTWGSNTNGILGSGTTVNRSSPLQVGASSWAAVYVGNSHAAAIDINGNLFTWGGNASGRLGDGTTVNKSSPVKIGTSSWSAVSAGGDATGAIDFFGSLYTWGTGGFAQLGDNTAVDRSSPVAVSSILFNDALNVYGSWTSVSAGGTHTVAIDIAGKLYTWGLGTSGQLGSGTTVNRSSPVLIVSGTSWTSVSAGDLFTTAVSTANTAYAWGFNSAGQLGDGTIVSKSAPVLISGFNTITGYNSILFNATNQYVTAASNAEFNFGSGNFTIEFWANRTTAAAQQMPITNRSSVSTTPNGFWFIDNNTTNLIRVVFGDTNSATQYTISSATNWPAINTWFHFAVVRNDTTLTAYLNGTSIGSVSVSTTSFGVTGPVYLAAFTNSTAWSFPGYISNVRIVKGTAVYTTTFTPSTTPLTAIANTVLLTAQSATFVDNGPNNVAITATNNPIISGISLDGSGRPPFTGSTSNTAPIINAGGSHTSAIGYANTLYMWGLGTSGQLGDRTLISKSSPVLITVYNEGSNVYDSWSTVSAGSTHTAAIDATGELYTWGLNNNGQIGDGTTVNKLSPVKIGTSSWSAVSAGGLHTAGITTTGALFTWGFGTSGQLGDNTTVNKSSPVQIGTSSWSSVSAGATHTAGVDSIGNLYTWGLGTSGQLGDNTVVNKSSPVKIGTSSWSAVSAGGLNTMATDHTNTLYGWGSNATGQLGDGTLVTKSSPVLTVSVPYTFTPTSWTSVTAGTSHLGAITSVGALYAWGSNATGQTGDGTTISKLVPVKIGSSSWSTVSAGLSHTTAIDSTGELFTWGGNTLGQIGDGTTINKSSPVQVGYDLLLSDTSFNLISSGSGNFSYGRGISGKLYSWGNNNSNQLGVAGGGFSVLPQTRINTANTFTSPVSVWSKVSLGAAHTLAIDTSGGLWTWGLGTSGQLGDSTTASKSSPVKIGTSSWTYVKAGPNFSSAIDITGRLFCWSNNDRASPAYNNTVITSPILIGASYKIVGTNAGSGGNGTTWWLSSNGFPYYAGYTTAGEKGSGQVDSGSGGGGYGGQTSSWTIISVGGVGGGSGYVVALTVDGGLFAWGSNAFGQLGDNSTTQKSLATNKVGTSSWAYVDAGINANTVGIDTIGRLFCWGDNTYGQLGDGTTVNKSSPIQIGTSSWTAVDARYGAALAIDINGRLFAWGLNSSGQLGTGDTINRSSPVQIGVSKSNWVTISTGQGHSAAIDSANTLYTWGLDSSGQLGNLK